MNSETHWERTYGSKGSDAVSWYRPHLELSLKLIRRAAPELSASIIDVGGGESTLVDDLVAQGYHNITVFDISRIAIEATQKRLQGRPRATSIGSSPILLIPNSSMLPMTYGMTALCSIF